MGIRKRRTRSDSPVTYQRRRRRRRRRRHRHRHRRRRRHHRRRERKRERVRPVSCLLSRVFSSPTEHTTATRTKKHARLGPKRRRYRFRDALSSTRSETHEKNTSCTLRHSDTGGEGRYEHAAEQQCSATFLWSASAGDSARGEPGVTTDRPRTPRGSRSQQEVSERASYLRDSVYRPAEGVVSRSRAFISLHGDSSGTT